MLRTSPLKMCVLLAPWFPSTIIVVWDANTRFSRLLRVIDFHVLLTSKYVFPGRICVRRVLICSRIGAEHNLTVENRHKMARLMHAQGGTYMKDLNEHVTHLIICGEAQTMDDDEVRTPKLLWALEQNKARQKQRLIHRQRSERRKFIEDSFELMPDIDIVWTEWFWDCLKSGGDVVFPIPVFIPSYSYVLISGRHLESDYSIERFRPQHTKDSPGRSYSFPLSLSAIY